jgi:hypothetical protein
MLAKLAFEFRVGSILFHREKNGELIVPQMLPSTADKCDWREC